MEIFNRTKPLIEGTTKTNVKKLSGKGKQAPPPPPIKKQVRTIDEIMGSKVNASKLILRANELEYMELKHSITSRFINLWFIGSFNNFDACTKLLNTEFKLDIYSKEIKKVIRELGTNELIDVQLEAPYDGKLTIRLIWEL